MARASWPSTKPQRWQQSASNRQGFRRLPVSYYSLMPQLHVLAVLLVSFHLTSLSLFRQGIQQQGPPQQVAAPVLPPPYHPSTQPGGHSLPTIADLAAGGPSAHHQPSPYNTHPPPPPPAPSNSLPSLGQSMTHQSPPGFMSRDREYQEMREREIRERELQRQIELEHREREARDRHERDREREREHMERMHREQQQQQQQQQQQHHAHQHPVQSHTGSIPIHQPVASKVPNSIHGPNGLLSNIGSGQITAASNTQAASGGGGGGSIFGMQSQPAGNPPRQTTFLHQQVGPPLSQPGPGFMGAGPAPGPGPSPMPGQAALGQGQQPILNVSLFPVSFLCLKNDDSKC